MAPTSIEPRVRVLTDDRRGVGRFTLSVGPTVARGGRPVGVLL